MVLRYVPMWSGHMAHNALLLVLDWLTLMAHAGSPLGDIDIDRNCCAFRAQKCESRGPKDNLVWVGEGYVGQKGKRYLLPT